MSQQATATKLCQDTTQCVKWLEVGVPLLYISLGGPHGTVLCDPLDEQAFLLPCISPNADSDHGSWGTELPAGVTHLLGKPGRSQAPWVASRG